MYQPRTYRHQIQSDDLVSCEVTVGETDLLVSAARNMDARAVKSVRKYRRQLTGYIRRHPEFAEALKPLPESDDMPAIVRAMTQAGRAAAVGPMAAVAGAIAEYVGRDLADYSPEIIIENGGDIYLAGRRVRSIGIHAGASPFSDRLALEIAPADLPCGVCTSSGTVGHSLSFGKADAVVVLAADTALADAAATAIANVVRDAAAINAAITRAQSITGLRGVVIILGDHLGIWGDVKLKQMAGVKDA